MTTSKRRVLLVDDDADVREQVRLLLEQAGFEVIEASNGRDALALARSPTPPDVIVLDLVMPQMDGWEFRAYQKRDPTIATTPVVVMTGDGSAKAAAVDAEACVHKPFDSQSLLDAVVGALSTADRRLAAARLAHTERLASLGTMAAGIAHEINNPLIVVIENLRQVARTLREQDGQADAATVERRLQQALECAERIRRIVRDVSTLARVEAPAVPVDLRVAVQTAVEITSRAFDDRSVSVSVAHEVLPPVLAPETHLIQVVMNLLMNAAQAISADGQGRVAIRTGTTSSGEAEIVVTDNGVGIAPELLARIFEPFFTTKEVGSGVGLGLWVTHGIVQSLGGRIEVQSELGRGTTFCVVLPIIPHRAHGAVAEASRRESS